MGAFDALKAVHFYRKVPHDLTEATLAGGTISLLSSLIMAYLFITSFSSFMRLDTHTAVRLDESQERKIQINFDVTVHHLPCRFASVDIADVMGTHLQNVSSNIKKTRVAADGSQLGAARVASVVHSAPINASPDKVPRLSPEMDSEALAKAVAANQLVLVNYFAPWCPWSRRLQPVWEEAYVNVIRSAREGEVLMAKADCTGRGQKLCQEQHVHAFPTIRIYRRHKKISYESYVGDRTHEALEAFVTSNAGGDEGQAMLEGSTEMGRVGEGCNVRGVVLVNRVPGNFHISAHSKAHSFQPGKLNMSHSVRYMTFGRQLTPAMRRLLPRDVAAAHDSLEGSTHIATGMNTTLEHYLKVVHTSYALSRRTIDTYQYTANSNHYSDDTSLPAAVFSYDTSPMQVLVSEERKSFGAFLTQLCAIIGGVFTGTGLVDGLIFHGGNTIRRKVELGKSI